MRTHLYSVFLPLLGLQILFKILNAFLGVIYIHSLHINATAVPNSGSTVLGIEQFLLILSPFILFVGYKYFYKHLMPIMILLMCFLTSYVGAQWGDPVVFNSLKSVMNVLVEGVLFWQLALLSTSKEQAVWTFPLYVFLPAIIVLLMHQNLFWINQIDLNSSSKLYSMLVALMVITIALIYYYQSVNRVDLKIKETFMQSLRTVFISPYFIAAFCVLVGVDFIIQLILTPTGKHSTFFIDMVGAIFIILTVCILPKGFSGRKLILSCLAFWLLGCNFLGVEALAEKVKQVNYVGIFTLFWPTVVLYPLIYRGFLKHEPEIRVLGFSYVIICSFLVSHLFTAFITFL